MRVAAIDQADVVGLIEDSFRERADPGLAEKSRHSIWQDADTGVGADQACHHVVTPRGNGARKTHPFGSNVNAIDEEWNSD